MSDYTRVYFDGLGIDFDLPSVAFSIGSYQVHWYGIIIAFGFILAVLYGGRMAYKWKMSLDGMTDVLIWGTIFGIIGARAYYVAFEWSYYKDHLAEIPQIWNGGIAIYGGIIGALIGAAIGCKTGKIDFHNLLDLGALGLLIGQGIGRWGNFFNQEAFGTNTDTALFRMWSVKIRDTLRASAQTLSAKGIEVDPDMPVHPTFLYESIWCILGFFILHYILKKHRKFKGEIFMLYGVWYGLERMVVEGLRTDSLYIGNTTIRVSQLLSLLIVIAALVCLIINFVRYKKDKLPDRLKIENNEEIEEEKKNMSQIIDGKAVSKQVRERVAQQTQELKVKGVTPGLAVIIVGEDPASQVYVRNKEKACEEVGFYSEKFALPENTTQEELNSLVKELNKRSEISGILCQLPLPKHLDDKEVINLIDPIKDVDAFHPVNVGAIMIGDYNFLPCTPAGVMELIHSTGVSVEGKKAVVMGRSNIVGKPMAMLLLHENATVEITHSKTKNLADITKEADILVAAIGKAKFVTADMVKDGAVVIDVGMNRDENGKLCGDVDFEAVKDKCSFITPVPGGVGPMTISMLMQNTLTAAKIQNGISDE